MPDLRKGAKGECCTLQLPLVCLHMHGEDPERETTVLAHLRTIKNGAGMAVKPDDERGVYACFACHQALDSHDPEFGDNIDLLVAVAIERTRCRQLFKGEI